MHCRVTARHEKVLQLRVLVNALSATAPSGQHVLFGHVRQLAEWTVGEHEFHVIACSKTKPVDDGFASNVFWHSATGFKSSWIDRMVWESNQLPRLMTERKIDIYFTPTGTTLLRSPVPQVSLAQNPWCMTSTVRKTVREHCKAAAQRFAYAQAQRTADFMVYNSHHMRRLYERNARGREARRFAVVYQGIHDSTHALATETRNPFEKERNTILCVSVMARWKNCETLLAGVRQLHDRGIPARLRLIGGWPQPCYRREIESEVHHLQLTRYVQIDGHVSQQELWSAYRSARIFCLLSRCESFGIPAVEAQAFGTPVVGSNSCAMPEIGGAGGIFVNPNDATEVANRMEELLTDERLWERVSNAAIANSERFRWDRCSRPLLEMFSTSSRDVPSNNNLEAVLS